MPIETGRYSKIDRNLRFCTLCNVNKIGDEYHLIFECTNHDIVELRNKYLPKYYTNNCNRHKLILLLKNVQHPKIGIPFGFFLKKPA